MSQLGAFSLARLRFQLSIESASCVVQFCSVELAPDIKRKVKERVALLLHLLLCVGVWYCSRFPVFDNRVLSFPSSIESSNTVRREELIFLWVRVGGRTT